MIVVTSDHGTEFYEHRRFDHGFTLYDEMVRVPLVVKLPDRPGGERIADRVSSIDVTPTVLDLAGVQVPRTAWPQFRGYSLVPALKGERVARDVFCETDYRAYTYKRAVVTPDGWKLIYTLETRSRELYFLNDDPGETKDLAAVETARADAMEKRLFDHFAKIGHDLNGKLWQIAGSHVGEYTLHARRHDLHANGDAL